MTERLTSPGRRLLLALVLVAVLWRLLGFVWLEDSPLLNEDPTSAAVGFVLARGLMGLGFIALGLLAMLRVPTRVSGVFALSAVSAGIYFGGPLPGSQELLQDAIWLFYFTVGAMLASAAFLHFTLIYPNPMKVTRRRVALVLLYSPVAIGAISMTMILMSPVSSSLRGALRGVFLTLETWQVAVYVVAALAVIPAKYIRANSQQRQAYGLDVMGLGLCAGFLPWALAVSAEWLIPSLRISEELDSEPLSLLFIFIPMGLCSALLHSSEPGLPNREP